MLGNREYQFIFQIQEVNRHVDIREKQPLWNCSFSSLCFLYKDNADTTILQIVQMGKVGPYIQLRRIRQFVLTPMSPWKQ